MSKLKPRKYWKIAFIPFNFVATCIIWSIFDVSWHEAWTGEFDD